MKTAVIVTGGNRQIEHYRHKIASLSSAYQVIGVDAGATWLLEHGEQLDLAVGDFDTIGEVGIGDLKRSQVKLIQALPEKDETDTELALAVALENQVNHILIYGGIGTRFDHSFANIHLLWRCHLAKVECEIVDPWNRIRMINHYLEIHREYNFLSLIPFTPTVNGVTLDGFKYPLQNATLKWGSGMGVSNELVNECGSIRLTDGWLVVIESND